MARDLDIQLKLRALVDGLPSIKGLQDGLSNVQKKAKEVEAQFKKVGDSFTSVGKKLSVGITLPLTGIAGLALNQAANLETLRVGFEGLAGGAEKAADVLKDLQDFTANTPFQFDDVASAGKNLLAFGVGTDELIDKLKTLGDISAGSGSSLGEIAQVYGKVLAAGKLTGETLLQFSERAIPLNKELAKVLGVSESAVKDLVSKGKVGVEELNKAFEGLTNGTGVFANQTEKQSRTLTGLFSTLKDNVSLILSDLGEAINNAFNIKGALQNITAFVQSARKSFNDLSDPVKNAIVFFGAAAAAAGPIALALGAIIPLLPTLAAGFASIGTAAAGFLSFLTLANAAIVGLAAVFIDIERRLGVFSDLFSTIGRVFSAFLPTVRAVADSTTAVGAAVTGSLSPLTRLFTILSNLVSLPLNGFLSAATAALSQFIQLAATVSEALNITSLSNSLQQAANELDAFAARRAQSIVDIVDNGLDFTPDLTSAKAAITQTKSDLQNLANTPPVTFTPTVGQIDTAALQFAKDEIKKEFDFIEQQTLEAQRTLVGTDLEDSLSRIGELGSASLASLEQELVAMLQTITDPEIAAQFERQIASIRAKSDDIVGAGLPAITAETSQIESALGQIDNKIASTFTSMIQGTESVGEAFGKLGNQILESIAGAAIQQAVSSLFSNLGGGLGAFSGGGPVQAFAGGGHVRGIGTSTSDSVLARLSDGEFVIKARAVKKIGLSNLNKLNNIDRFPKLAMPKFNTGGLVTMMGNLNSNIKNMPIPRFNTGGIVNSDNVSASGPQVKININNNSSAGDVKAQQTQSFDGKQLVVDIMLDDIQNNGRISRGLQRGFGLKR